MTILINSYLFVASDVTPDSLAASYSTSNEYGFANTHTNNYFQIAGISSSITLKVSLADSNERLYYRKTAVTPVAELTQNPLDGGWTELSNNSTFSVSNNEYVVIAGYYLLSTFTEFTADILNASDLDNTLTEINCLVDNT